MGLEDLRSRRLDTALHGGHQLARVHRLAKDACGVQVVEGRVAVGEDDDGELPVARVRRDLLANRPAVDVRQHHGQDDGIELVAVENRQCLYTVSGLARSEAVERQGDRQQSPEIVVVFDEKDGSGGWHRAWLLSAVLLLRRGRRFSRSARHFVGGGARRVVAPAELIDTSPERPNLFGEMPQARIDFVFQRHQKRDFVFNEYISRRITRDYA